MTEEEKAKVEELFNIARRYLSEHPELGPERLAHTFKDHQGLYAVGLNTGEVKLPEKDYVFHRYEILVWGDQPHQVSVKEVEYDTRRKVRGPDIIIDGNIVETWTLEDE